MPNENRPVKVSIIVPVYRVAKYVEQCARSLFEQTLREIEIIFVDDCSPDNSIQIIQNVLESYPERKPQVRILRNSQNRGLAYTRKVGIMAAQGDYFLNVDSDDYVETDMAEELYNEAVRSNADIVVCNAFLHDGDKVTVTNLFPNGRIGDGENLRDEMLNRIAWPSIWLRLFRRTLLDSPNLIWPMHNNAEDVVFCSSFHYNAKVLSCVNKLLYHYRILSQSISRERSVQAAVNRFNDSYVNLKMVNAFLEEQGVAEKYQRGIIRNKIETVNQLGPLLGQRKYRKLWFTTYPELQKAMFFGEALHPSSWRNKLWVIAVWLGLYPRLGHILLSRRLRPDSDWWVLLKIEKYKGKLPER